MPELPEVETIRRGLQAHVAGRQVSGLRLTLPKLRRLVPPAHRRRIVGATIRSVARRGKIVLFDLSNGFTLLVHLKMTGQLIWREHRRVVLAGGHPIPTVGGQLPGPVTHAVFTFRDGSELFFNDLRQFGYLKLISSAEAADASELKALGIDPLTPGFTQSFFDGLLSRRPKAKLKPFLLDQTLVAGLGNIYVDEALNLARLHPLRTAGSLNGVQRKRLREAIVTILRTALRYGGTSDNTYVTVLGGKGDYLRHARVYHRTGEPCRRCGTSIERSVVAGRGTHVCPRCQRLPNP